MAHYFGFVPSDKLKALITEAEQVVESNESVDYYPYRDALTHQTARDLIDNLLVLADGSLRTGYRVGFELCARDG